MKKIISVILILTLIATGTAFAFAATPDYSAWDSKPAYPTDVVNTKYFTAVKHLMDKKVLTGYEDGLFHPEKNVSRAEMAKMLILATNNSSNMSLYGERETFSDLSGYTWAKSYINTAAALEMIKGVGDGKFNPSGDVTYAEALTMIIRIRDEIRDSDVPGTWPNNYIEYATRYNMAANVTITDWNAPASRGDIAMILYRNLP